MGSHRTQQAQASAVRRIVGALVGFGLLAAACGGDPAAGLPGFNVANSAPGQAHQLIDVAGDVGLDFRHGAFRWEVTEDPVAMMGGGVCWLDYDRDGWLDLYVVNSYAESEWAKWQDDGGLPTNALFRNEDGQRFVDVSAESGADLQVRGNGCVAADLDDDGWTDVYVTTARFNALLWNEGDGTFTEGAEAAGVDSYGWQAGAAVGDLNGDGRQDLVVTGYVDMADRIAEGIRGFPNTQEPRPDLLFINQGEADGRPEFVEAALDVGLGSRGEEYGLGVILTDVDRDGDLDLYVANDTNPNRLYLAERDPDHPQGVRLVERQDAEADDRNSGMGVASGDFTGDGRFDLFVTNFGDQRHTVLTNESLPGAPRFVDGLTTAKLPNLGVGLTGWGTSWGDLDLDGDLDLFVVSGNVPLVDMESDRQPIEVFLNQRRDGESGKFVNGDAVLGVNDLRTIVGRGSAMGDYDNDGDLDIAVVDLGGQLMLLDNVAPPGSWLVVVLEEPAPGTVVSVTLPTGAVLEREVHAGSSYLSSEDPRPHFGLGNATEVRNVTVRWPDGTTVELGELAANQAVTAAKP
jgi:hypothetical protein